MPVSKYYFHFFLVLMACLNCCVCKKYYNYTLFRSYPRNKAHMDFFIEMAKQYDVDFWLPPVSPYRTVDFIISPTNRSTLLTEASLLGLNMTNIIEDIQSEFDKQVAKPYTRTKITTFDWKDYFRLNDIYRWLEDINTVNPHEMELINIGKSHEQRDIMAVRIALNGSSLRSKVFIEGGIHAREWISPAFVTFMIHQILNSPKSKNKNLRKIAKTYEWYFVPVLNPDGYEYSHTEDRMWRKNRNGLGVDLNRNWGHAFGTVGVSKNMYSQIYCGTRAFSEKESKAMADFIRTKSKDIEYYLSFHSYMQALIIPYANSKKHLENYSEMKNMCTKAAQQLKKKYKASYKTGTGFETIGYLASGDSSDWVKYQFRVPYVSTIELRDRSKHGFALPPSEILPTCLETLDGVLSLLQPQTKKFTYLRESQPKFNHQVYIILDKNVFIFNVILFIINDLY